MAAKVLQRLDILLFANTAQYRSEMRDTQQSTTTMMGAIKADATAMAKVGAKAFAGMAAASTVAIGAMIKEQVELGTEMTRLSRIANTSVEDMQKLTYAAKAMGVEQDTLGDIYKDTQDKIGDFLSSGGGAMADYFENVAPLIGQTAEEFRTLSGPEALQKYYDGLQQANLSQSEMIFYLEGIASDASALIPLLHDNGAGFDVWATAAENAGAVMSAKTITATQELQASTDLLMLSYDGAKKQFTQALIPVLSDVAGQLVGSGNAADFARESGDKLVQTIKLLAKAGTVVATVFKTVGTVIGGAAATVTTLLDGVSITDGAMITALKIARNGSTAANVIRDLSFDTRQIWADASTNFARIDALGTGPTNKFVSTVMSQNMAQQELNRTLGLTGQAVQANAQAEADAAKVAEANAKKQASAAKAASKAAALMPKAVSDAILDGAKKLGINPNDLAAVISFETAGTFSTNARNPTSSATGLIQFMDGSDGKDDGKYFGMTRNQFGNLLPLQQMEHVVSYLKGRGIKPGAGVAEVYDAVAGYGYKRGSAGYESNKVWDVNNDGIVAKGEAVTGKRFKAHIKDYYGDGVAIAQQSISQIMQSEITAAAEQARVAEQQAKERTAIRLEYSDEATRIEEQLKTKILQISASGFSDNERDAFIADAIEIANEKLAQMQLLHDQDMQYAQQAKQTDAERIRNQYALERREIQLTVNMDEKLRTAKLDALNQAEQLALDERRYAYERELRDLTSIGQSDLRSLRQYYAEERRVIDTRTDVDSNQKSNLRNALAGAEIYNVRELQKGPRDAINGQQAAMNGTGESYGLAQQYQGRLDVIQDALDAEVIAVEQAEQAKYAARYEFEAAATQLTLSQAEATAGGLAASFKTMLGEQNTAYKMLFAGQQAFVMASAGLNMWDAYGDAMAEGATMSQKFAAAATIAAEFGRIITAASSMTLELPGYQTGGYTGTGGLADVAGLVHKEEFVSNASTTKRYRPELEAMHNGTYERQDNNAAPNVNVNVSVTMEGKSSVESDHKVGRELGNLIAATVRQQIIKEQRQGGSLHRGR